MTCNKKPCEQMEVQELVDLPIDNLDSLPEFLLAERAILDGATGKVMHSITRVPAQTLFPNGNNANIFPLDGNNPSIEIIEGQPIPAYVQNEVTHNIVYPADGTHPAQFLIVGKQGDTLLCQATGVINVLGNHQYTVGQTYYRSKTAGEVTTDANQTGQKLFYVASQSKLIVKL